MCLSNARRLHPRTPGFVAVLTAALAQQFVSAEVREDVAEARAEVVEEIEASEADVVAEVREIAARLRQLIWSEVCQVRMLAGPACAGPFFRRGERTGRCRRLCHG